MLRSKSFFSTISDSSGCTGQNVLYYDTSTKKVQYSSTPITSFALSGTNSTVTTTTNATRTSTTYLTYLTSASLPAGRYFVIVSFMWNWTTSNSEIRVQISNVSTSTEFGNLAIIELNTTNMSGAGLTGSTSGISTLTNTNVFTFQFNRNSGSGTINMKGATMVCFRVG